MDLIHDIGGNGSAGLRRLWSVANVEFDEAIWALRVDAEEVHLDRKAIEVFRLLLDSAPNLVSKQCLAEEIWSGRVLSESVIAKAVSRLRQAIGDQKQDIIRTVHGRGYRIALPVVLHRRS